MWNQHALARVWRHIVPATIPWKHHNKKFEFSVISYNILSQLLLENNSYLYRSIDNEYLKSNRCRVLIKEIESYDPDIVCMQEFDHQIRETSIRTSVQKVSKTFTNGNPMCHIKRKMMVVS